VKPGRLRSTVRPTPRPARKAVAPPPRLRRPAAPKGSAPAHRRPHPQVAQIIDVSDSSLLDVLDNLLNQGVVLNAEIILALADVDLIYLRLSALLCAADRVFPPARAR
jgi:hypothetical protein